MQKLHYTIVIDAPRQKVWDTMLNDNTYRQWTEPFSKGSYYQGDWSKGSKMLFLAPDKDGKLTGMVSKVKDNRPHEFISLEHLGVVENGIEDTASEKVKDWAGAHENYTLSEAYGKTTVRVDLDSSEEFAKMFGDMWPKALHKLKVLAETNY